MVFPRDLWYVVNSVKIDIDLTSTTHDLKFYKWAVDAFRRLNMANILSTQKTVKLTLDDYNAVLLPDDYVDYMKIGACVGGYIVNFDANENICLKRDAPCNCDTIVSALSNTTNLYYDEWMYLPYFHNGQFVAGLFGKGEGFYGGGYRIDHELRKIQFDDYVTVDDIILEYESSGGIENGNAYIPEYAVDAMRQYVHWQRCKFSRDPDEHADVERMRRDFKVAATQALRKVAGMTPNEILSIVRSSFHQMPKR